MSLNEAMINVFRKLISNGDLILIKSRGNELISDYVIRSDLCPNISLEDTQDTERELVWNQVITAGFGSKLSINRIILRLNGDGKATSLYLVLMGSSRRKSSENIVFSCDKGESAVMGKSVLDVLINSDLLMRILNNTGERRKEYSDYIKSLVKRIEGMRKSVDTEIRKIISLFHWYEE